MEVVPEVLYPLLETGLTYDAAVVAYETQVASEIAALDAEIAAMTAETEALLVESGVLIDMEAVEAVSGPLGWIAAAMTAVILAGVTTAIILEKGKIDRMMDDLGRLQDKKRKIEAYVPPAPPPEVIKPPIHTAVEDVLKSMPNGLVVDSSGLFDCAYNTIYSRCARKKVRKFGR